MAQCSQSAQELVQTTFAPTVAVLCSHDAEVVCQKNNLSFVEMVQPFCRLNTEAHVRDSGNQSNVIHNFTINVRDFNSQPPAATVAKKMLNDIVAASQPENNRSNVITVGDYDLQISANTPWFEAFRESFMDLSQSSDHEFLKHFLACIFVVSSGHPDPMDQFTKLTHQQGTHQHQSMGKMPRWFCPNILRYYVLLHDVVDGEEEKAEAIYQSLKSTYGAPSCHLLTTNSLSPQTLESLGADTTTNIADPWTRFMFAKEAVMESQNPESKVTQTAHTLDNKVEVKDRIVSVSEKVNPTIAHPLDDVSDNSKMNPVANHLDNIGDIKDPQNNVQSNQKPTQVKHGACLTISDHDRLKIFIHEFIVRGLIPWSERTMRTLHDQMSSRKGIHKTLFSATKKWFGSNKPMNVPVAAETRTNVVYTNEAPEMQMRRLADLSFMFQLYEMAYQTYHTLKRDFRNDNAWLHHAGTLEMASLAIFMQGSNSQRQYPHHYMESAISLYLTTCNSPQFATRATLLNSEALKSKGMYQEAAMQFIKMTSEDSDLRSAVLLEQAAHCFMNMKNPRVRKYAFHMILAGHRYSKASQRKHALRSYSQALQVFKGKNWTLAEDHINFTIGRQSFNLKQYENSTAAFKHLLTTDSKQTASQQNAFFREYLFIFKQQLNQPPPDGVVVSPQTLPQLPLPVVESNITKVLLRDAQSPSKTDGVEFASSVNFNDTEGLRATWQKLEELVISSLNGGSLPSTLKPQIQCFTNQTDNSGNPCAVVNEMLTLQVVLRNPFKIPLVLTDVLLLWRFLPSNGEEVGNQEKLPQPISNESETVQDPISNEVVHTEVISEVLLEGGEDTQLRLRLTPHQTGELHVTGLACNLGTTYTSQHHQAPPAGTNAAPSKPSFTSSITVRGCLNLEVQGPRLNNSKQEKASKMYGPDRRLDLLVVPPLPNLQVTFYGFPEKMFCGQVQETSVEFTNNGTVGLKNLKVVSTDPAFFTFGKSRPSRPEQEMHYVYETLPDGSGGHREFTEHIQDVEYIQSVPLQCESLPPGGTVTVPLWIQGPIHSGVREICFLFYYESTASHPKLSHRVLRHTVTITTAPSVGFRAVARRGTTVINDNQGQVRVNNLNLCLWAENLHQGEENVEINLLQVSCASQSWVLEHLSTQRHTDVKIGMGESELFSLKAHRCSTHTPETKTENAIFSNVTFDQYQIHSAASPCADFYFRSRTRESFEELEVEVLNPAFLAPVVEEPKSDHEDLEAAQDAHLTLIVLWKACSKSHGEMITVMGQHHIALSRLNQPVYSPALPMDKDDNDPVKIIPDPTPTEPSPPEPHLVANLLKCSINHPNTVSHNFSKARLCVVPVTVTLYNCSAASLEVSLNASSNRNNSDEKPAYTSLYLPYPSSEFTWVGHGGSTVTLSPDVTDHRTLHACFCQPGIYNLATLNVTARQTGAQNDCENYAQESLPPSLIIVEKTDS